MVKAVSESNLPPERWRPLFDKAGIEFGYRPLATRAGLTHTRVHRLIRGGGTTDDAIRQVAKALGVKESKVRELRGESAVEIEPFTLPDDAGRLTHNERDVIRSMVRALLDARDSANADTATTPSTPTSSGTPLEGRSPEEAAPGDRPGVVRHLRPTDEDDPTPDFSDPSLAARNVPDEPKD